MLSNTPATMEIDLHGFHVEQAKVYLKSKIDSAPKTVRYITVIHGYNHGTVLRDMVRSMSHPRIRRIEVGLNFGETTIYLN